MGTLGFTRNANDDATVTSVCNRCQLTVGRAWHPTDLHELELRHVCQPVERRRVVRIAHHVYYRSASRSLGEVGAARLELRQWETEGGD